MDVKIALALLVCLCTASYAHDSCFYPTAFDSNWMKKCPKGSFVSHLVSSFQERFNDRMWMVCCRKLTSLPVPVRCKKWTGYKNKFLADLNFRCPTNSFIAGIASTHSDKLEDRRYKFKCCSAGGVILQTCTTRNDMNELRAFIDFNVTSGHVIAGFSSTFSSQEKDRQFQATTCQVKA